MALSIGCVVPGGIYKEAGIYKEYEGPDSDVTDIAALQRALKIGENRPRT